MWFKMEGRKDKEQQTMVTENSDRQQQSMKAIPNVVMQTQQLQIREGMAKGQKDNTRWTPVKRKGDEGGASGSHTKDQNGNVVGEEIID